MMKKSDWAIREEKQRMMGAVRELQRRYRVLDDQAFNLEKDLAIVEKAIERYGEDLKKPLFRFFTGDVLQMVVEESHDEFIKSVREYFRSGALKIPTHTAEYLMESLKVQLVQNIEQLINGSTGNLKARAVELKKVAAQSVNDAVTAQLTATQYKIEAITEATTGATGDDIAKAWQGLKDKYGTRETVKYRNGANFPLNSYLDMRANTTSADIHRTTTQLDASASGVFTGMVSRHGATDSCRPWEGKILFFTPEGRDIMSRQYPQVRDWPTVDEVKRDPETHMWKPHCRHIITAYPIQFFDRAEIEAVIEEQAA